MKNKIKIIFFDIGGVLKLGKYSFLAMRRHHALSIHHFMAKKLKIDLDQWFDSIDTPYAKSIEGTIPRSKAISIIAKNLKISKEKLESLWIKAYKKHFKKNKKLFSIIEKIKKQGYKVGILSDQWYLSKDALVIPKDLEIFDPVIISCDVGVRKPNLKIYKLALKKANVKANESLFIDNQIWNIKPAKKLGMKTILFKNNKQLIHDLNKLKITL